VVALGLIWLGGEVAKIYPALKFFAPIEFKPSVAWSVAPVTVVFIGMVVFNNLCLKYVEVSFYQVILCFVVRGGFFFVCFFVQTARSLTIVFSVVLTWFVLQTRTSLNAMACCGIVIIGFVVGSAGEVNFSLVGWAFGTRKF
jgi:GDP-fucose transporter C1